MPSVLLYVVVPIAGYLIGSFPTGVVLTRRKYGIDVREMGSGNIGATNVTRVFGWYAGVWVLVVDFLKGYVPVWAVHKYYAGSYWLCFLAAMSLVLGHCFSLFLKFRGGKGVATSLGVIVVLLPWAAAVGTAVYAVVLAISRISALGSLAGITATWIYLLIDEPPRPISLLIIGISAVVIFRHRSNIERLWHDMKERKKKSKRPSTSASKP